MFGFLTRKPEPLVQIQTFRGAVNGWQIRTVRSRADALRFLVLLNRIENNLLHKAVTV